MWKDVTDVGHEWTEVNIVPGSPQDAAMSVLLLDVLDPLCAQHVL
jgi:hypothetical protein